MSEHVVFLERDSVPVRFARPRCAATYVEYPASESFQVVERLRDATVAIINKVPLREAALAALPKLRLIAVAATGYDCVDVGICRERGIAVSNVRGYAVHAVPEHVFALLLALRRNLIGYRARVAAGAWQTSRQFCTFDGEIRDLHGATFGVIGRGSIGRAVAQIASGFGMRVVFGSAREPAHDSECLSVAELLRQSDVVSLHCPLTPATRGLIGERELRSMKRDAILINTARGGLVDEPALARALAEGWIAGAGFDVLTVEPPRDGNVLLGLDLPNFILTPHVAWASTEAMQALADQLSGNIDAWAAGTPRNLVG